MDEARDRLLALRDELRATAATTDEQAQVVELDQSKVGRLSRMDAMQAQAMAVESVARREQKLLDIAAALQRLDEGEYGWCLECGEEIATARLQVDDRAIRLTWSIHGPKKAETIRYTYRE